MIEPLLVKASLASPLAGDAPHLDAIMEYVLSPYCPGRRPGEKLNRGLPCPVQRMIRIPLPIRKIVDMDGKVWQVAACSSPILSASDSESVEYVNSRFTAEDADLLKESSRGYLNVTGGHFKSHRVPVRVRRVGTVAWFAVGVRREVLKVVRRVQAIGHKRSVGYGKVAKWTVERTDADYSWFAPTGNGQPMLMRPLATGDHIPKVLLGSRPDFGACVPPYWHQDRFTELVVPC